MSEFYEFIVNAVVDIYDLMSTTAEIMACVTLLTSSLEPKEEEDEEEYVEPIL